MNYLEDMGESYEADYYKSVTDDLRVANEHLNQTVSELRTRLAHTDHAYTLIRELLTHLEDGNPIEDTIWKMHQLFANKP